MPFVFLLTDFLLSRTRIVPRHFVFVALYGAAYMVVNAVATDTQGVPVYPILTWRSWLTAAFALGARAAALGGVFSRAAAMSHVPRERAGAFLLIVLGWCVGIGVQHYRDGALAHVWAPTELDTSLVAVA